MDTGTRRILALLQQFWTEHRANTAAVADPLDEKHRFRDAYQHLLHIPPDSPAWLPAAVALDHYGCLIADTHNSAAEWSKFVQQQVAFTSQMRSERQPVPTEVLAEAQHLLAPLHIQVDPEWIAAVYNPEAEAGNSTSLVLATTHVDTKSGLASIQLPSMWRSRKRRFLGYVTRAQVLAHEILHFVRAPLQSRKYEELLVYYLTNSVPKWRPLRMLSSVIETRSEYFIGVLLTYLSIASDLWKWTRTVRNQVESVPSQYFYWSSKSLLLVTVLYTFLRWMSKLSTLRHVVRILTTAFDRTRALQLMVRLTDADIDAMKQVGTASTLCQWIAERASTSLRWAVLKQAYHLDGEE